MFCTAKTFFAGGDLHDLGRARKEDAAAVAAMVREGKAQLRRLETLGVPVVAAINGAALGGGLEICLACRHRMIVDDAKAVVGFPEVQLGLLPGAGGVVRSVRMLGLVSALMSLLLQGQRLRLATAKELGVVDQIVATRDDLPPAAKAWISAQNEDFAGQPWDQKGYRIPGGTRSHPALAQNLPAFPANLRKRLKGADLVIEAVFEDPAVKAQVFAEIEPHLTDGALLGSNTSILPITQLAEGVSRPAGFIGLHFFSAMDKMPLLEIIKGEDTSEETLHRALDVAKQIDRTPIVVNDSRGFFTSRVINTFIKEGIAMLLEGVPAPTIEQASSQAGYPAPVLQLSDELNLNLLRKIRRQREAAAEAEGQAWVAHPSTMVVDPMLDEFDRGGRLAGARFHDYEEGKRVRAVAGPARGVPSGRRPLDALAEGSAGAHAL